VALLLVFACAGNSPASTVERFYRDIGDGKVDDALDLLSEQTIKTIGKEKLLAGLRKATRAALDKGGIKGVEITNEQIANELANVTAIVRYGNGSAETERVKLVKESLSWRLQPEK
jgi:hypothetical protein